MQAVFFLQGLKTSGRLLKCKKCTKFKIVQSGGHQSLDFGLWYIVALTSPRLCHLRPLRFPSHHQTLPLTHCHIE